MAFLYSLIIFVLLGFLTVLIPNVYFTRMTPVSFFDYIFLFFTSLLSGTYLSFHQYLKKNKNLKCDFTATGEGMGGFLGFGCSIGNKILIFLLGVIGVINYIEPYHPFFELISTSALGYAVYTQR